MINELETPSNDDRSTLESTDRDEGTPRRRFLASLEHGVYLVLRLPVFAFLALFRRVAGR
jgi:hypothetical protein